MPSYFVLQRGATWEIYRAGCLVFRLSPRFAVALLTELARYGCPIVFG
jgi:hypothetical protein